MPQGMWLLLQHVAGAFGLTNVSRKMQVGFPEQNLTYKPHVFRKTTVQLTVTKLIGKQPVHPEQSGLMPYTEGYLHS